MRSLFYMDSTLMMLLLMLTMMMTIMMTAANETGPPVQKHPDICDSMSPIQGHYVEPEMSAPPFEIRILSNSECYQVNEPVEAQVVSADDSTFFEGFFVQARTVQSDSYNTGTFDVLGDAQLQLLTCGDTMENNAVGHREARHYTHKNFTWTPNDNHGDVRFVATIVHERAEYWVNVTSSTLRYDVNCVSNSATAAITTSMMLFGQFLLLASATFVLNGLYRNS